MTEIEPTPIHRRGVTRCAARLTSALVLAALLPSKTAMARSEGAVMAPLMSEAESGPLRITVEPTIDDAALIPEWIHTRNPKVAEKVPSVVGHEQWIAVEIGGTTYDYRVSVAAMRDGVPVGAAGEPKVCECNSEKLLELVDARIEAEIQELRARVPAAETVDEDGQGETVQGAESGQTGPGPNDRQSDDHPSHLGAIGFLGIGVGVLGVGMLAGGIPLALRPDESRGGAGSFSSHSTRPPGIALAVGGSIALAGGVALTIVDLLRHRKPLIAVVPAFGPRHVGLSVTRNF